MEARVSLLSNRLFASKGVCVCGGRGERGCWSLCGYEVERRLEQSNLFVSQVCLFQMVDWVISRRVNESRYTGSLTLKGNWPWWLCMGALLPHLPLEVSSCPCVMCLSNVEGWWIACRWSNLMQLNHSGIRRVCVGLLGITGRW